MTESNNQKQEIRDFVEILKPLSTEKRLIAYGFIAGMNADREMEQPA